MTLTQMTNLSQSAIDAFALIASYLLLALFVLAAAAAVFRFVQEARAKVVEGTAPVSPALSRMERRNLRAFLPVRALLWCLLAAVASRLVLYGVAWVADGLQNGGLREPLSQIPQLFTRADGPHYLGIADVGYQTVGDPRFHIVFFPLFPWLVRPLGYLMGDFFWASAIENTIFTGLALYMTLLLARVDQPHDQARRAAAMALLWPAAFFMAAPYTEAFSLFLTAALLYALRKRRFALAAAFGFCAALTRSTGLVLLAPYGAEALLSLIRERRGHAGWRFAGRCALALLIPVGFCVYLYVNYAVTGSPLTFLAYQRDHWSQQVGNLMLTAGYTVRNIFSFDVSTACTVWIPQLVCMFFAAALLVGGRRLHAPVAVFGVCYLYAVLSPTWLLSAPRYLLLCVPLFLLLARWTQKPWQRAIAYPLLAGAQLAYALCFALGLSVY